LLVPQIAVTGKRGASYQQPILWVISPSEDLTISPQINSKVNPFLTLDWRERFYSGELDARVGYTYEQDFNGNRHQVRTGDLTVLHPGQWRLQPDAQLVVGVHRRPHVGPAHIRQVRHT